MYKLYEETDPIPLQFLTLQDLTKGRENAIRFENVHHYLINHNKGQSSSYVGACQILTLQDSIGHNFVKFKSFFIEKEHRAKGLGSKLITKITEFAKKQKIYQVRYGCFSDNQNAIKFYEQFGFKQFGNMYLMLEIQNQEVVVESTTVVSPLKSDLFGQALSKIGAVEEFVDLLEQENAPLKGAELGPILSSLPVFQLPEPSTDLNPDGGYCKEDAYKPLTLVVLDALGNEVVGVWGVVTIPSNLPGEFIPIPDHFLLNSKFLPSGETIFREAMFHLINELEKAYGCSQIWLEKQLNHEKEKPKYLDVRSVIVNKFKFEDRDLCLFHKSVHH